MITQRSKVATTMWRPKEIDTSGGIVDAFVLIATVARAVDCLLDHNTAETVRQPENRSFLVVPQGAGNFADSLPRP
jgi:hypothetical protein